MKNGKVKPISFTIFDDWDFDALKNYFAILGLSANASTAQIKSAYRSLAKVYHPDGHHPDRSAARFIEVNEAYEFLLDPLRRREFRLKAESAARKYHGRREDLYREWMAAQQMKTRQRAQKHAEQSYDAFMESPIFKAAMVLHGVYDYIFAGVGVVIVLAPLLAYYRANTSDEIKDLHAWDIAIPIVLGVSFSYGIYYFLFKNKKDAN